MEVIDVRVIGHRKLKNGVDAVVRILVFIKISGRLPKSILYKVRLNQQKDNIKLQANFTLLLLVTPVFIIFCEMGRRQEKLYEYNTID